MGNAESNPWIGITQQAQQIEKIRFSYDLKKNPDDFNRYVSERIDRITNETLEKKRAAFQKAHIDLGRYMDMDHNATFYKIRNRDLSGIQDQMAERSRAAVSGIKHDKDLTRRQVEINQWYFEDKLETLFFLQLFFMVMLASVVIIWLQRNAFITMPFAAFLTSVLFAIVVAAGLYRWRYTSDFRDPRFWSKRNFHRKQEESVCEGKSCEPKKPACNETPEPSCPGPDWDKMGSDAEKYVEDTLSPYGDIMEDTASGVGAGAALGVGGLAVGSAVIAGSLGSGGYRTANTIRMQAGNVGKQIGSGMSRAESQLEADTIAYITGDNRTKAAPAQSCPFGGTPTVDGAPPPPRPMGATS